MQPAIESRTVTARGVTSAASFGMRAENSAHIFNILRSTLYSNKVLAVLREYSANAWDEHRAAGIPDRPIKVVVPTALEPTLRIRDYGRGLSEQQVFEVYTQYGSSTKREDDLTVGCLGIGSKSAFAYADAFTVTSWHGGQKSVYVAVLDETNVGTMSLMHREPCDPSETGVEISVAVDVSDCVQFRREAEDLFPHFVPQPDINIPLTQPAVRERSPHGGIGGHRWVAVMGCIPYALDLSSVRDALQARGLYALFHTAGVLRFDIGEVSISASRESLEYTNRTKDAVLRKVEALVADLRRQIAEVEVDPSLTDWERRLSVRSLSTALGINNSTRWSASDVALKSSRSALDPLASNDPKSFTMRRPHRHMSKPLEATWSVAVGPSARILIRDVNRSHRGIPTTVDDRIVYPIGTSTVDAAVDELNTLLRAAGLDGIPIVRMSTLPFTAPSKRRTSSGVTTPAKSERLFVLKASAYDSYNRTTPSANWQAVDHTPSGDDVYVVLDGFRTSDDWSFMSNLSADRVIFRWLGLTPPPVIGYRSSANLKRTDIRGTEYNAWRTQAIRRALDANPDRAAEYETYRRSEFRTQMRSWRNSRFDATLNAVIAQFGADSPMRAFLSTLVGVSKPDDSSAMRKLDDIGVDPVKEASRTVFGRYPLLDPENGGPSLSILVEEVRSAHWIAYINRTDREQP